MSIRALALFVICGILYSNPAWSIHVISKQANIDINTPKVIRIDGFITEETPAKIIAQQFNIDAYEGDTVVFIDSLGGSEESGVAALVLLSAERAMGDKLICVGDKSVTSMAFNIMSFCDVRLMTAGTTSVVHKLAFGYIMPTLRITAKQLRRLAMELDRSDAMYKKQNMATMHLSARDYDKFADKDYQWTAEELLKIGYLQGIAVINDF